MSHDEGDLSSDLLRCAGGDREALRAIFESESGRMIAVAQRILGRRDMAEEAVQDAFVRIWRKASQYRKDGGSAHGWVYAIVRNRALNILRDTARELPTDIAAAEAAGGFAFAPIDAPFADLDEKSHLRECLARLDETKRRCVLMAYCFGFTHGEIAGRLGAPLGTVKAWVRRGLAALRECLQ